MDLRLLQTFVCVVEAGSLTGAGRRLFLCQSAVSRRITRLEQIVGAWLLHRDTAHCALTDTGKRLLPIATSLLQQADRLDQFIAHSRIPSQSQPQARPAVADRPLAETAAAP